jgi:hypothetical protein
MKMKVLLLAALPLMAFVNVAAAQQYPIMEEVADKLIAKYQSETCEQLWQQRAQAKGKPRPEREERAIRLLQEDPAMRQAFINRISGPIMNKMFQCGMIP